MSEPIINPTELAVKRRKLGQEYNLYMKEMGEILKRKAFAIIEIRARDGVKSDKQAERMYDITEDGQKFIELNFKAKGLIELIRSLKTEIDIKNNEAMGNY